MRVEPQEIPEWLRADVADTSSAMPAPHSTDPQRRPWEPRANPNAGVSDLAWYQRNKARLGNYRGLWVAISRGTVLHSAATASEVYDYLNRREYPDALVLRVPYDLGSGGEFIG